MGQSVGQLRDGTPLYVGDVVAGRDSVSGNPLTYTIMAAGRVGNVQAKRHDDGYIVDKSIAYLDKKISTTTPGVTVSNVDNTNSGGTVKIYSGRIIEKDADGNSVSVLFTADDIKAKDEATAHRVLLIRAVKAGKVDETTLFASNITLLG